MFTSESSQRFPVVLSLLLVTALQPAEGDEEPPGEEDGLDGLHDLHGLQLPVIDGGEDVARPQSRPGHGTVGADAGDPDLQREVLLQSVGDSEAPPLLHGAPLDLPHHVWWPGDGPALHHRSAHLRSRSERRGEESLLLTLALFLEPGPSWWTEREGR